MEYALWALLASIIYVAYHVIRILESIDRKLGVIAGKIQSEEVNERLSAFHDRPGK